MKKLFVCVMILLMAGTVWAQDFSTQVKKNFSGSILNSVTTKDGIGYVIFKDLPKMPEYFRTGDKINKVFAVESARLFRELPDLRGLKMTIPLKEKTYAMGITREQIEKFYGLRFSAMKGNLEAWRNKFIRKYDSRKSRAKFAAKFVK